MTTPKRKKTGMYLVRNPRGIQPGIAVLSLHDRDYFEGDLLTRQDFSSEATLDWFLERGLVEETTRG